MGAASSKLKVGEEIGRGAYGTVHKGVYEGKPVAVKKIHRLLLDYARDDPEAFQRISSEFERECDMLKTLVCPNVVQFVGAFEIAGERMLVMELLHETLAGALKRKKGTGGLTEKEAGRISLDIARGLNFLHRRNPPLVHRDLNTKNILLTEGGAAKISDLGVSKFRPTDLGYLTTKAPGCLLYMPPEALGKDPKYTEKLDMFSFGVVMLQMITGEDPNPDMLGIGVVPEVERRKDHIKLVPSGHVLEEWILQCLEDDPSKRLTAQTVLQCLEDHPILFHCSDFCTTPKGFHLPSVQVCLVGGHAVGRASLLFRYQHGYFNDCLGVNSGYSGFCCQYTGTQVTLWETWGATENLATGNKVLYRRMNGFAVLVDVTNMQSLEDARFWKQVADSSNPRSPLPAILLATKCDLVDMRTVTAEALAELAEELQCFTYMEVSALTGQNVKEAFTMLFDKIIAVEAILQCQEATSHQA